MQIDNAISYYATSSDPHINTEQHMAAWVAKLLHQADTYDAWQSSVDEEADAQTSEGLRRRYEGACDQVRASTEILRPALACYPSSHAVAVLRTRAKQLQVTHLTRLRDDEVTAGAELKIARALAYKATLGMRRSLNEIQQTSELRDLQSDLVHAISRARKSALQDADADVRDTAERPLAPTYKKPTSGILRAPQSRTAPKKSVHWQICMPATPPRVEAWIPASRARAGSK